MFRTLSTRSGRGRGYERMVDESKDALSDAKLQRTTSLPTKAFGNSVRDFNPGLYIPAKSPVEKKAKKAGKVHPLFGLFNKRQWKKTTADPAFSRYLEYVKEGGYKI